MAAVTGGGGGFAKLQPRILASWGEECRRNSLVDGASLGN